MGSMSYSSPDAGSPHLSCFLEFKNLTFSRDGVKVLHNISLSIHNGEHIALLGPNGSGKSTLIKTITRELYPMNTGEQQVFHIWEQEQWNVFDLRSQLGVVSQDLQYSFNRNVTGREVLLSGFFSSIGLFHQTITPAMERKVDDIAAFLEIVPLLERPMTSLSSGESRRLLIGRALVHNPKVLILDEPTSSLDLQALHILRQHLRKIAQTGIMIILVTHQLHDIIPEINRILMIKEGRILYDGKKESILTAHHVSELFSVHIQVKEEGGYYYATGY